MISFQQRCRELAGSNNDSVYRTVLTSSQIPLLSIIYRRSGSMFVALLLRCEAIPCKNDVAIHAWGRC